MVGAVVLLHVEPVHHFLDALQLGRRGGGLRGRQLRGRRRLRRDDDRRRDGDGALRDRRRAGRRLVPVRPRTAAEAARGAAAAALQVRRQHRVEGRAQPRWKVVRREAVVCVAGRYAAAARARRAVVAAALERVQRRHRRVARVVAQERRVLGGQRQVSVEQVQIEILLVAHRGRRGRVLQQRQVVRRVDAVRVQVRQKMRGRMDGRADRDVRHRVRYRARVVAVLRAARRPERAARAAAHALRAARVAAVALRVVRVVQLEPPPQHLLAVRLRVAEPGEVVEPGCKERTKEDDSALESPASMVSGRNALAASRVLT